ncbi:helix-turn-helix transcriptional regulator [Niallia oryzisoli]|uniref:Helix-turn-helix transcriptional regulator n=1 Tax=Niallia oryzisoli TaxID=1737571 RepID=A0ABZ2CKL7_9BACI
MIKLNLKQIMKDQKLSLTDLSELTGISTNSLGALANGKSNGIQFHTLEKILDATGCRVEELIHNVGSLYTISLLRDSNNYGSFTNLEAKPFAYNIQFKNQDNGKTGILKIQVSALLNKVHLPKSNIDKISIQILFMDFILENESDKELSFFIKNADDSLMTALAHLIATELLWNYQSEGINHNSSILFSWYGFPNVSHNCNDILIKPFPYELSVSDGNTTELKFDYVSPFIADLNSLTRTFPNIKNVSHNAETGKTSISIYSK